MHKIAYEFLFMMLRSRMEQLVEMLEANRSSVLLIKTIIGSCQ